MEIHERLKEIRIERGVTQTHIASRLGRTPGWYSNLERGERGISAEDLEKIAQVLKVKPSDFFKN